MQQTAELCSALSNLVHGWQTQLAPGGEEREHFVLQAARFVDFARKMCQESPLDSGTQASLSRGASLAGAASELSAV